MLITGTGGRREAARLFATHGATVVGCDLDPTTSEETVRILVGQGLELHACAPVELRDRQQVTDWVDKALALYLASDESRWITGTSLVVDGGRRCC